MDETRQPTILGRPRTRPLNPEQELMQSVIDANAPPPPPPPPPPMEQQQRHVSSSTAARHKEKYLAMKERYERTNLLYSQYKETLSLAEIKQRELQDEIDLLLEGLLEAVHKQHTTVTVPPLPRYDAAPPLSDSEELYYQDTSMYEDHPPASNGGRRRDESDRSYS